MSLADELAAAGFTMEESERLSANKWFLESSAHSRELVSRRIKGLAEDLKVPDARARAIIASWPPMLGMQMMTGDGQATRYGIGHRIKNLAEDLDVEVDALTGPKGRLTRWPQLLSYQLETQEASGKAYRIEGRISDLASDLGIDDMKKARKIVYGYPSILARQEKVDVEGGTRYSIMGRISDLSEDLGQKDDSLARKIIRDCPSIVGCQVEAVEGGRVRHSLTTRIGALMKDFSCGREDVAVMLRKQANIIGLQQADDRYSLGKHILEAQNALSWVGFSNDESLALMRRDPTVLTYTEKRLTYAARQLRRLAQSGSFKVDEVKNLIAENPNILYMSPYATEVRAGKSEKISDLRLAWLGGSAPEHAKEGLERLDPSTLKCAVDRTLTQAEPHDTEGLRKSMRPLRKKN